MEAVIKALTGAAKSLVHPIILVIVLMPMLIALAIWIGVGWIYWDIWTSTIQTVVVDHASFTWMANWPTGGTPNAATSTSNVFRWCREQVIY